MKATKFLKLVSKEPALWDVDHPEYKDIELKQRKWKEIADEFLISYKEAMSRFKSIRDKYRREKRQIVERPDLEREKWELMEHLTFLDSVRPRNARSTHLDDIPPAPIHRSHNYSVVSSTSGHATRLSTGSLRQPSYAELPLPALAPRPPTQPSPKSPPLPGEQSQHQITPQPPQLKPAPIRKLQRQPVTQYKAEPSVVVSQSSPTPPPAKVRKVSLGGFIDQMVDQEPEMAREKFSLEILDAVVKIKRQFLDDRQNNLM